MLKYTLGALAAAIIMIVAAFAILAQVTDGGADQGRAPLIIISAYDDGVWPPEIKVKRDEITEISLQNNAAVNKAAKLEGDAVEQLPALAVGEESSSRDSLPHISIEASPGMAESELVRFAKAGEYTMYIIVPGVYFPGFPVKVLVE